MKRILSILLLAAFIVQSTSQMWIIGSFIANRDYIVKNLCINRANIESDCKGSCQLKKKIDQNREQNEKSAFEHKTNIITLFTQQAHYIIECDQLICDEDTDFHSCYKEIVPQQYIIAIFHPPAIIA